MAQPLAEGLRARRPLHHSQRTGLPASDPARHPSRRNGYGSTLGTRRDRCVSLSWSLTGPLGWFDGPEPVADLVGDTGFEPVTLTLWRYWLVSVKSAPDQHLCTTVTPSRHGHKRTPQDRN